MFQAFWESSLEGSLLQKVSTGTATKIHGDTNKILQHEFMFSAVSKSFRLRQMLLQLLLRPIEGFLSAVENSVYSLAL